MIVRKIFFNIRCDCCGMLLDEEMWHDTPDTLEAIMDENNFEKVDGKHYCLDCYCKKFKDTLSQ